MNVSVSTAKVHLTDLVRRAEAGEEVVLTRHGRPTVKLSRVEVSARRAESAPEERAERLAEVFKWIEERSRTHAALPGPCAARSQDFLYDDSGMPG